jgi:hypothetical protein
VNPDIIAAEGSRHSQGLQVLIHYLTSESSQAPVGLIEQIEGRQFVERSFRWPEPFNISAITACAMAGAARPDLVMALHESRTHTTTFVCAPAFKGFDYRKIIRLFHMPDSLGEVRGLTAGKMNDDSLTDILAFLGPPAYSAGVAIGTSERTVLPPSRWYPGIRPSIDQGVVVHDVDGDGAVDIAYVDAGESCIKACYGYPDGGFAPPVTLLAVSPGTHIAAGVMRPGHAIDLVTSDALTHTITIHPGVFSR